MAGVSRIILRLPSVYDGKREANYNIFLQQLGICRAHFEIQCYAWLYFDTGNPMLQMRFARELLESNNLASAFLWLDLEDDTTMVKGELVDYIDQALALTDVSLGIYSAAWWWGLHLSGIERWQHLPLWYAHYDYKEDFEDWPSVKFGGWDSPTMKQFTDRADFGSLKVDLNVFKN